MAGNNVSDDAPRFTDTGREHRTDPLFVVYFCRAKFDRGETRNKVAKEANAVDRKSRQVHVEIGDLKGCDITRSHCLQKQFVERLRKHWATPAIQTTSLSADVVANVNATMIFQKPSAQGVIHD